MCTGLSLSTHFPNLIAVAARSHSYKARAMAEDQQRRVPLETGSTVFLNDITMRQTLGSLSRRSQRAVWHPCTRLRTSDEGAPLAIVRGEGSLAL